MRSLSWGPVDQRGQTFSSPSRRALSSAHSGQQRGHQPLPCASLRVYGGWRAGHFPEVETPEIGRPGPRDRHALGREVAGGSPGWHGFLARDGYPRSARARCLDGRAEFSGFRHQEIFCQRGKGMLIPSSRPASVKVQKPRISFVGAKPGKPDLSRFLNGFVHRRKNHRGKIARQWHCPLYAPIWSAFAP